MCKIKRLGGCPNFICIGDVFYRKGGKELAKRSKKNQEWKNFILYSDIKKLILTLILQ
jgi:hypothetical protein